MRKKSTSYSQLSKMDRKKEKWAYIFLLPWVLVFCVFFAYPLLYGFAISFTNFDIKGNMDFIGLKNFIDIFEDYRFWRSFAGSLRYAVIIIPLQIFLPLWAANTLHNHKRRVQNISKVLIYLPGVLCSTALITVWKFMLAPTSGVISIFLKNLGFQGSLMDNANYSIPTIAIFMVLSGLGSNLIIYGAALNGISTDYYEAAELDGASRAQQFWKITVPLLKPTVTYVMVTATIGALQIFAIPKLMNGGGPNYTSSTLIMLLYDSAFVDNEYAYAAALGTIVFIVSAVFAGIQFRMTENKDKE